MDFLQGLDSALISSLTVTEMLSLLSRRRRMGDLSVQLESVLFAALLDAIDRGWLQRYPLDALHLVVAVDLGGSMLATADGVMVFI